MGTEIIHKFAEFTSLSGKNIQLSLNILTFSKINVLALDYETLFLFGVGPSFKKGRKGANCP